MRTWTSGSNGLFTVVPQTNAVARSLKEFLVSLESARVTSWVRGLLKIPYCARTCSGTGVTVLQNTGPESMDLRDLAEARQSMESGGLLREEQA